MKIKYCRICRNPKLIHIGSLGNIAISNFTLHPYSGRKSPLSLVFCPDCTLLQLTDNPQRSALYEEHYWYESHLNPKIVSDLKSVVNDALKVVSAKSGDVWVDIGANDGTLLSFVPKKFIKIGIDPAKNLKPKLKIHAKKVFQNYFEKVNLPTKSKVITAIAMFYDLPNPNLFTKKIKTNLDKNGVAIIQLMTLSPMIENNDLGNICHEHTEYYSYKSLVRLFEQNGLEIFKVNINDMNGGSYRLFVRHFLKGSISFKEKKYSERSLKRFFKNVERNKNEFLAFVKKLSKEKKKLVAYGASTKGNTILQYYGLNAQIIPTVVDVNPEKIGRFLIGSKIKIVDKIPEDCDYLWILPYAFLEFFLKKETSFIKRGGKFVVSTPKFKVI